MLEPIEVDTEVEGVTTDSTDVEVEDVGSGGGGGGIVVCLIDDLVGLGFAIWSFALLIFASHPLTRSTDFPFGRCVLSLPSIPRPSPTSMPVGLFPADPVVDCDHPPSFPSATIRATFLLIGVLGGELPPAIAASEPRLLDDVEPGVVRWLLVVEEVRVNKRVWYAKIDGDEGMPLGGEVGP